MMLCPHDKRQMVSFSAVSANVRLKPGCKRFDLLMHLGQASQQTDIGRPFGKFPPTQPPYHRLRHCGHVASGDTAHIEEG